MKTALLGVMVSVGLAASSPASAQDPALAGLYLAEPRPFDRLFENGLELARYPVLALRADGSFAVYLLGTFCDPLDHTGRLVVEPGRTDPRLVELCDRAVADSEPDLGDETAVLIARGTWRSEPTFDGTALTFVSEFRQTVPVWIREGIGEQEGYPPRQGTWQWLLYSLWSPPYLDDPSTLAWRSKDHLRLSFGETPRWAFVFRAYRREALVGGNTLVGGLSASRVQYFRCAVAMVDVALARAPQERSEVERDALSLIESFGEINEINREMRRLQHAADADRERVVQLAERLVAVHSRLQQSSLFQQRSAVGAALGCPERDQR